MCDNIFRLPFWPVHPIQHESIEYTGAIAVDHAKGKADWLPFESLLPNDPKWVDSASSSTRPRN